MHTSTTQMEKKMNKIQTTVFFALMFLASAAQAGPSEAECEITAAIDSPAATFVKLPIILTNPFSAFAFAASSYRNSLCPRPELITREQAQVMIDAAVAQRLEQIGGVRQASIMANVGK
jgi:hypothetical protein